MGCSAWHKDNGAPVCTIVCWGIIAEYEDRILPLERGGAEWAARFRAHAQRSGRTLDLGDALIAGTAKTHDLAIATRNVRDFDGLEVKMVNPWETR